jgi:UDP-N-acetylglucosamine 3-dehydrogenase
MNTFAIIGAGAVAQTRYLPALLDNPDARVDWVVDVNEERAEEVATEANANYATDYTSVLEETDAVVLSTPPKFHAEVARDCIEGGVHVFTEKPVALSSEEAKTLVERGSEREIQYAISRQYREAPAIRLLHALVERGTIGEIQSVRARFGDETDWEFASTYRVTEDLAGGGVLSDKGPHLMDVVRWILGDELAVEEYRDDSYGGLEANAELAFSVPGTGTTGTLEVTGSRSITNRIELVGSAGEMSADPDGTEVSLRTDGMDDRTLVTSTEQDPPRTSLERMARQVDRYVDSLESGTQSYVPASTGVEILELIEDCYGSPQPLEKPWERVPVADGGKR